MREDHNKAAEHRKSAAKSHRAAADAHGKNDHAKGKEYSTQAQQHSQNAHTNYKPRTRRASSRSNVATGSRRMSASPYKNKFQNAALRHGGNHIVRRQRPPDPLQLELAHRLDLHGVLDFHQHSRADQNLPRLGFVAEARGHIGYRPDGGIVEARIN